jgi:hypothetical protein
MHTETFFRNHINYNKKIIIQLFYDIDKSLAVYRKIYVQSVVYYTNPA